MNILSSGNVLNVNITNAGSGYTTATVSIAPPTSGVQATAVATVAGGIITEIVITNAGYGYNSIPAVTITGDGSNAAGEAVISANDYVDQYNSFDQWRVKTNRIVDATINGQRRGNMIAAGRSVTSVQIVNGGTGYTSPTIAFSSPSTSVYLDVNLTNTLTGNVVTNLTGTIKQIVISATTTNEGSVYVGDTISQSSGTIKGRIIQKNGSSILISVLKGTFTNTSATTSPGNVSVTLSSVTSVSSATGRITSYDSANKRFIVDTIVGTFNLTNLASVSTSVADGFEFVNLSQVDSSGTTATATLTVTSGVITGVTMTNFGSRYEVAPTITITGASTTPAILQPILDPKPNSFLVFDGTKYVDKPLSDEIFVTHTSTKASARWNRAKRGYFTSITQLY